MLSDYDRNNVKEIVERPQADWFSANLFKALAVADQHTRDRVREEFPDHVALIDEHYPNQPDFYDHLMHLYGGADDSNLSKLHKVFGYKMFIRLQQRYWGK